MARGTRSGLAMVLAIAACVMLPSSAPVVSRPTVDDETKQQLTVAARSLLERRSEALVQKPRRRDRQSPSEVLGVQISPVVVRNQDRALRELANRNRAPVEGGPAYTGARTRLRADRAVRTGDRITLEATEHTEVRYENGSLTQSVRRRFEFTTQGEQITLVGERVLDPSVHPVNDPDHH
ncbi:hypothetical protein [Actinomadura rudentiformis]|uniref:Uncharacterized protein n=1 Tax=Actinomadura rudentiformis TaxID=359158 RepID=A0A6H9YYP4_9ACTN|nr:hypothetical protein [Actinomadura rudentiformis]KAB2351663.1 hypothetical protein F8566_05435 [Actinomadura rudentiformis]